MAATVTVGRVFFDDHQERGLDTPKVVRAVRGAKTGRPGRVTFRLDDPAVAELLADAEFYADPAGPDQCPPGLVASARALAKAIRAAQEGR